MDYITIGAYIGTGFAVFVTFILFLQGYAPKICVAPLLIVALILCLLLGFSVYQLDADKKNNKTIKTTISANYDDTVNHHNNNEQSFVSDSSKKPQDGIKLCSNRYYIWSNFNIFCRSRVL